MCSYIYLASITFLSYLAAYLKHCLEGRCSGITWKKKSISMAYAVSKLSDETATCTCELVRFLVTSTSELPEKPLTLPLWIPL